MKVHYLQHVPFENLGYIENWLKENNHDISVTRFYEKNYSLPAPSGIDALIIMGGPMGVNDEDKLSWLKEEKAFIKNCIQSGKKVLGICLGAQLIADCLGSKVGKAKHKEIGWFTVKPTEDCKQLPWFYNLFKNNPTVFHWHGDQFQIPGKGALNLLFSQANTNQAFLYGENVLGLQFHLEVTEESINELLKYGASELMQRSFIQTIPEIKNGRKFIHRCNKKMSEILCNWLPD